MKRNITITTYKSDDYLDIPQKADEFMAFWQGLLDEVPAEYRNSAKVKLDAEPYYGGTALLSVSVAYTRPETDQEERDRESQEENKKAQVRLRELEQLAKLKAKYGEVT